MTTDIFLRSYAKDFPWLSYALRSIRKFATGFRDVVIAIPDTDELPEAGGVRVIKVKDVMPAVGDEVRYVEAIGRNPGEDKVAATCKGCKFWRRAGRFIDTGTPSSYVPKKETVVEKISKTVSLIYEPANFAIKTGLCLHPSNGSDYRDAWMPTLRPAGGPEDGVQGYSDDQRGGLETGEDFGCIHFQEKDK